MKDFEKVFSGSGNKIAVLINRLSDPSSWILNVYKKVLFFKKKIDSYWFTNRADAEQFALNYMIANP